VLVLEDDRDLEPVFRAALRRIGRGIRLDWATGSGAAIALLNRISYDVVVADEMLAEGSGLEAKRWLESYKPAMPFAMVSAAPLVKELARKEGGTVPFLPKPFSLDELHRLLVRLLHNG
jgi:two-component system response regulator PilR (NtrC family)